MGKRYTLDNLAILISSKMYCKTNNKVTRDKEHLIIIKESIHYQKISLNIYAPNNRAPKHIKKKLMKL